jgi:hypothetical protein
MGVSSFEGGSRGKQAMTNESALRTVRWIHEVRVDDAVTLRRGKLGSQMIAEWPGFARLTCASDGSHATLRPAVGVPRRAIEQLRDGTVNALLRDLAGHLTLHASAVVMGDRAVVFLGESGAGKSTAAAEMCLRHHASMLADDVVLLEIGAAGAEVLPGQTRHRLTHDSCLALGVAGQRFSAGDGKRELRAPNAADRSYPLGLVIALRFEPTLGRAVVRSLPGGEAARQLLAAAIRFDVEDRAARKREFEQVTTLYRCTAFLELVRSLAVPGEVAPFVLDALRKEHP